jgi:hypothetical protein
MNANSEEEALHLFVMCFALLQERKACQILETVLNVSHQFQDVFGVTRTTEEIHSKKPQQKGTIKHVNWM